MLKKSLIAKTNAKANDNQIYIADDIRITYITSRLLRVEAGGYTDLPSYAVWFRNFESGKMSVSKIKDRIFAETEDIILEIRHRKPYCVTFKDSGDIQYFSKQKNLKGTYRTLDGTIGKIPLGNGFITDGGVYLFDDSKSMLLNSDGKFVARETDFKDYYVFAYGKNYRETINAFYKISSPVPLVPRYALGVWWSRYHAYTQKEYLDLMDRFEKEGIPLTVATVDMDWHWVDIKSQFGEKINGWTGYSWNTKLFPDYKAFLKQLKDKNLHVTLNLHPADGVRFFEDQYEEMAKANGIDPATKKDIRFSCSSDAYWNSYFDILHKPYEKDGVDFWWIDWQQGLSSDVKGLDPLCALNHYHFLDNAEDGRMPLILSRYGGAGSHRYPLGFSGDTQISWNVLDFQPYFTANAANAAYSWWSHDIGGHHFGYRDDDLYLRWVQFGVFSPVLRLHSTANRLLGKEPWKYRADVCCSAKKYLNLRHRLIPYLFTANYRTHNDGIALCEPMYYTYPNEENAYKVKNQYMFGSELMVCPITKPQNKETGMGSVEAWIPDGEYTDIFTLQTYKGAQMITLNRELYDIPVLAKSGAVIPLSNDSTNTCENPEALEVWSFRGTNSYEMFEDSGKSTEQKLAKTAFENVFDNENHVQKLKISVSGDLSVIPNSRTYTIHFKNIRSDKIMVNGAEIAEISYDKNGCPIVKFAFSEKETEIIIENIGDLEKESYEDMVIKIMSRWQGSTTKKAALYKIFEGLTDKNSIFRALYRAKIPKPVFDWIYEILSQG